MFARLKKYVAAPVCIFSNALFYAGKAFMGLSAFGAWALKSPGNLVVSGIGVGCNVVANFLTRAPAIMKRLNPPPVNREAALVINQPADAPPREETGWLAWSVEKGLNGASLTFGGLNALIAYVSAIELAEVIGNFFDHTVHDTAKKEVPIQIAAIIIALSALYTYLVYDQVNLKRNTKMLAESIDAREKPNGKAFGKTMLASALNLLSFPMLAFFLADKTLNRFATVQKILGPVMIKCVTGFASVSTFFTVIGWLPSVYAYFKVEAPPAPAEAPIPPHPATQTMYAAFLRHTTTLTGAGDSIGSGLGTAVSIAFTFNKLIGASAKHPLVIAASAAGGVNAVIINYFFGVIPGRKNLMFALQERAERNAPQAPLDDTPPDEEHVPLLLGGSLTDYQTIDPAENRVTLTV